MRGAEQTVRKVRVREITAIEAAQVTTESLTKRLERPYPFNSLVDGVLDLLSRTLGLLYRYIPVTVSIELRQRLSELVHSGVVYYRVF